MARRLLWWVTAAVLITAIALLPRLDAEPGEDSLAAGVGLGEMAEVRGGELTVERITAARQWSDGSDPVKLDDGYFVEVQLMVNPAQESTAPVGTIRSNGRTYRTSDETFPEYVEAGFDSPATLLFEVPDDVLSGGQVRVQLQRGSDITIELSDETVERADQVGES